MHCLIYSTHPSLEQARSTASLLLDGQLAACCNILPGVESHYRWEGERTHGAEWVMLSKTTAILAEAAMQTIKSAHPFDCPAILQIPVEGGNPAFLAWLENSVKAPVDL